MNITGKYLKVWKVEEKNGYTHLNLGDSQKKKDGTKEYCTWFDAVLFGEAAKKSFQEGDFVEVTSGSIFQEEYNGKWYTRIKIFHIHKMDLPDQQPPPAEAPKSSPFESYKPGPKPGDFGSSKKFEDDKIPF